ncbi:MAG: hypothetical protein RPS47_15295 [Colwellia sp.]|jgi:hypothetical protein
MLTTAIKVAITVPTDEFLGHNTYSCTCYGDNNDKNLFYLVPETVAYKKAVNGGPTFVYYAYRGGSSSGGGYTMFTVYNPIPGQGSALESQVKNALQSGLNPKLKAKSKLIVGMVVAYNKWQKAPTDETLQKAYENKFKATLLNQTDATKYIELYNPNSGDDQFVAGLSPTELKIQSANLTVGDATLTLDNNQDFVRDFDASVKPSGLANNDTVFAVPLTQDGAVLFEKTLSGTEDNSAPVKVAFNYSCTASLPAADVEVSYNSKQFKKVSQTMENKWLSTPTKNIEKEYTDSNALVVKVNAYATADEMGMTQDEYLKWKQQLTDWGNQQAQQILADQTGLDMSRNLLQDADGYKKFTESLTNTKDFKRTFTSNTVVEFQLNPQAQLPSIASIVGKEKLPKYFKKYDLNDPFYATLQPEFIVAVDYEKYEIENVIVYLTYGSNKDSLLFDKSSDNTQKTLKAWNAILQGDDYVHKYTYYYEVNYNTASGPAKFTSDTVETANLIVSVNANRSGIVYVQPKTIMAESVWDKLYNNIVLTLKYADSDDNIPLREIPIQINSANQADISPYVYPIGTEQDKPVYYTTKFYTKNGDNFHYIDKAKETAEKPGWGQTRANILNLDNPLAATDTINFYITGELSDVEFINVTVTYVYNQIEYSQQQQHNLTKSDIAAGKLYFGLTFAKMGDADTPPVITYEANFITTTGAKVAKGNIPTDSTFQAIPKPS